MVKSCWICKTSGNKLNKSYFRIPKVVSHRNSEISELSALRLEKWRDVLRLPDDTSGIRICSDHFLSGNPGRLLDINDPDWIPTKNLKHKTGGAVKISANMEDSILRLVKGARKSQENNEICCRLCFKLVCKQKCFNIFQDLNKKIFGMITAILGHTITFDQGVSSYVCGSCLRKIHVCASLLTYFRKNEKLLESKLFKSRTSVKCMKLYDTCEKSKVQEPDEVNETESTNPEPRRNEESQVMEKLNGTYNVQIDGIYDREQIRSIIEDNSLSSENELTEDMNLTKWKRRKYDFQSVKLRPIELKTLKCNNCFRKFSDLDGLKTHKNFCQLLYCQLCKPQAIFKDNYEREKHKKRYHGHSLVCQICGNSYSQSYLVKHFKNHFEDRKKCPFCNKTLKNITILMAHIDNVHGNRSSSICDICGGNFKNLKKHLVLCRKSGN